MSVNIDGTSYYVNINATEGDVVTVDGFSFVNILENEEGIFRFQSDVGTICMEANGSGAGEAGDVMVGRFCDPNRPLQVGYRKLRAKKWN